MISSINESSYKRPALKRDEIVESIHSQIISGKMKPSDRLPTRRYLQKKFDVSMVTIQQAIDQLADEGFLESRGIRGTFVVKNPPNLNHYAIVVQASLNSDSPMFWKALVEEFSKLKESSGKNLKIYYCHDSNPNSDFSQLLRDVERHCVAGLIFIDNPFPFEHTLLVSKPGIPRVAITSREDQKKFNTASVSLGKTFIPKALDYFLENGKRKVAVITNPRKDDWWKEFEKGLAERRMEMRPYWKICFHHEIRADLRNLSNLLMQLPEDKLPDAILITDDNIAEPAIFGLVDSGSKAVKKLKIVTHCNFPMQISSPIPVKFLGNDSRQVVDACMRCLERQRKGEHFLDVYENIEPVFDDERKLAILQ